jgi:hypothetical protein
MDYLKKVGFFIVSLILTIIYTLVYFFLFSFMATSSYSKGGGWGGKLGTEGLGWLFLILFLLIISIMIIITIKTKPKKILHIIYLEFIVLKWSSLFAFVAGIWSTWYFYHTLGIIGYIAMLIWDIILFFIYQMLKGFSVKILDKLDDWKNSLRWKEIMDKMKDKNKGDVDMEKLKMVEVEDSNLNPATIKVDIIKSVKKIDLSIPNEGELYGYDKNPKIKYGIELIDSNGNKYYKYFNSENERNEFYDNLVKSM